MGEKPLAYQIGKMRKKNQILNYHASSSEGYDQEDTRLIDEKPPNPMGY